MGEEVSKVKLTLDVRVDDVGIRCLVSRSALPSLSLFTRVLQAVLSCCNSTRILAADQTVCLAGKRQNYESKVSGVCDVAATKEPVSHSQCFELISDGGDSGRGVSL